jgi:hypothetical protein
LSVKTFLFPKQERVASFAVTSGASPFPAINASPSLAYLSQI